MILVLRHLVFRSILYYNPVNSNSIFKSSPGGLGVDRWSDNRLHSARVDRIPLEDIYMVKILTKKELWTCYKLSGLWYDPTYLGVRWLIHLHLFHTLQTYTTKTYSTHRILNQKTCKGTSSWFPGTKVQMARSKPLIHEADPHITKLAMEARM